VATWRGLQATGLNNTQPVLATGAIAETAAPLAFSALLSLPLAGDIPDGVITYAGAAPSSVAGVTQINFQIPVSPVHGLTPLTLQLTNSAQLSTEPGSFSSQPVDF
jgi:uncharacterized protein (TIGR03437 family)